MTSCILPAVCLALVCLSGLCHRGAGREIVKQESQLKPPAVIPKSETKDPVLKIVGGSEAPQNQYPWIAHIQVQPGLYWAFRCGGSLIAPQFVITARHCVADFNPSQVRVILGDHDRTEHDVGERQIFVSTIHLHSTADLAILELSSAASITDQVKTIPYIPSEPGIGVNLMVAGWGQTQSQISNSLAAKLQHIVIPVTADSDCNEEIPDVAQDEFCAGEDLDTYTNVCHGDSGGPAMIQLASSNPDVTYILLGVVARGTAGCPADSNYAVFQSLLGHGPWIEGITGVPMLCFPGDAMVTLHSAVKKRMDQVIPGDKVLALTPEGSFVYSDVIMMMHANHNSVSEYLTIHTEDQDVALRISAKHMVYAMRAGEQDTNYIFAKAVQVGDYVFVAKSNNLDGHSLSRLAVVNVSCEYQAGAFAPLTSEGTVVVDGVVASSYAYVESQTLCHLALWPVRVAHAWAPYLLTPDKFKESGPVHWAPALLQSVASPWL